MPQQIVNKRIMIARGKVHAEQMMVDTGIVHQTLLDDQTGVIDIAGIFPCEDMQGMDVEEWVQRQASGDAMLEPLGVILRDNEYAILSEEPSEYMEGSGYEDNIPAVG